MASIRKIGAGLPKNYRLYPSAAVGFDLKAMLIISLGSLYVLFVLFWQFRAGDPLVDLWLDGKYEATLNGCLEAWAKAAVLATRQRPALMTNGFRSIVFFSAMTRSKAGEWGAVVVMSAA